MKALIPSHKENKRYLLVQGRNLKSAIPKLIKEFVGILGFAEAAPRWISTNESVGILSINRKSLNHVRAAIAISKEKIEIVKVSGTLKKLRLGT